MNYSIYFGAGKYTVSEIGLAGYCENAEQGWIPDTIAHMAQIYNAAGISYAGVVEDGDTSLGYSGVYMSSSARTYKEFKQGWGPWARSTYYTGTMSNYGCSITSVAIFLNGYGYNVDPAYIRDTYMSASTKLISLTEVVRKYIPNIRRPSGSNSTLKTTICDTLSKGKPVIIHVYGWKNGGTSDYTVTEHWMTLIDINDNQVYVSDPSGNGKNGWANIDTVLKGLQEIVYEP